MRCTFCGDPLDASDYARHRNICKDFIRHQAAAQLEWLNSTYGKDDGRRETRICEDLRKHVQEVRDHIAQRNYGTARTSLVDALTAIDDLTPGVKALEDDAWKYRDLSDS